MGGSNIFSRIGEVAATGNSPAPSPGGKGGRSVEPAAEPAVGPTLPVSQPSENLPINVIGDLPMSIDTTSTGGGKGGAPMPSAPATEPQMFDNTGRLVDSTLLMQQAILGRQPMQYQPLITPESYQNFYSTPAASYGSNAPAVPDYRPMANQFKQAAADAAAAAAETGSGRDTGSSDGLSYDPNGSVNLAPVRVIDVNTGEVVSVDPGGTTASGMPGSYLGVGTVGDDSTGPEYDYGTVDNSGVTVTPVQESNVTGTDLGLLGTIGGDYGPPAPEGLSNEGTNAPDVSLNYEIPYSGSTPSPYYTGGDNKGGALSYGSVDLFSPSYSSGSNVDYSPPSSFEPTYSGANMSNVDSEGVTVTPIQDSNVTGVDLGMLDYWGQPYGLDLGSGRSSGGYSDNGTGVGVGGGPVGAGGGNAARGYSYGGW